MKINKPIDKKNNIELKITVTMNTKIKYKPIK